MSQMSQKKSKLVSKLVRTLLYVFYSHIILFLIYFYYGPVLLTNFCLFFAAFGILFQKKIAGGEAMVFRKTFSRKKVT